MADHHPPFCCRLSGQKLLQSRSTKISRPLLGFLHRLVAILRCLGSTTRHYSKSVTQTAWKHCTDGAEHALHRRPTGSEEYLWPQQRVHQGEIHAIYHEQLALLRPRKSDFYFIQAALSNGEPLPSLFSTTDENYHANLRKSVNSAFSMTALVQYEPSVDKATAKFLDQTDALFVAKNAICDFAQWLQFLAFDVIGQITYSKRHGFVDRGEDVDGMVGYLGRLFSYIGPVSFSSLHNPTIQTHLSIDRSNAYPRPLSPEESHLLLPRQTQNHVLHLSRRPFRSSPHGRTARGDEIDESQGSRPKHHHRQRSW